MMVLLRTSDDSSMIRERIRPEEEVVVEVVEEVVVEVVVEVVEEVVEEVAEELQEEAVVEPQEVIRNNNWWNGWTTDIDGEFWEGDLTRSSGSYYGEESYDLNDGSYPVDQFNCQLVWDLVAQDDTSSNVLVVHFKFKYKPLLKVVHTLSMMELVREILLPQLLDMV